MRAKPRGAGFAAADGTALSASPLAAAHGRPRRRPTDLHRRLLLRKRIDLPRGGKRHRHGVRGRAGARSGDARCHAVDDEHEAQAPGASRNALATAKSRSRMTCGQRSSTRRFTPRRQPCRSRRRLSQLVSNSSSRWRTRGQLEASSAAVTPRTRRSRGRLAEGRRARAAAPSPRRTALAAEAEAAKARAAAANAAAEKAAEEKAALHAKADNGHAPVSAAEAAAAERRGGGEEGRGGGGTNLPGGGGGEARAAAARKRPPSRVGVTERLGGGGTVVLQRGAARSRRRSTHRDNPLHNHSAVRCPPRPAGAGVSPRRRRGRPRRRTRTRGDGTAIGSRQRPAAPAERRTRPRRACALSMAHDGGPARA